AAALGPNQAIEAAGTARTLAGSGRALPGQELAIVHPETLGRCAPGEVGEIWVAGPSVAQGYWGRPDETAQTLHATLDGGGPFLRTGDLGFVQDGELYVAGRLKDLIIIRGRNYYPQHIGLTVERSHPSLPPGRGAAFSVRAPGD